jgi:hypothetical protein
MARTTLCLLGNSHLYSSFIVDPTNSGEQGRTQKGLVKRISNVG